MDGVLNIAKASGPTSHDVVADIRRLFGQKRVGHAGTLDPMATGVLVVCLGKATRIVEYITDSKKCYRAKMVLGQSTDTQDSTGAIIAEHDASSITRESFDAAAMSFQGDIEQIPPMVSALKYQGKPLYKLAREGKSIERAPRRISIYSIEVLDFTPGKLTEAEICVCCSSGTYIRTLCSDIGDKLGCGGHMSMLERTQVGSFRIENAVTIKDLTLAKENGTLESCVIPIAAALSHLPPVELSSDEIKRICHGMPIARPFVAGNIGLVQMVSGDGSVIAIGTESSEDGAVTLVKPRKVLAELDVCETTE